MNNRYLYLRISLIFILAAFLSRFQEAAGLWSLGLSDRAFLPVSLLVSGAVSFIFFLFINFIKNNKILISISRIPVNSAGPAGYPQGFFFGHPLLFYMIIFLFSFFILYSLRLQYFRHPPSGMGDSLHLISHVPVFAHLFGYLSSTDEILSLWLYSVFYLFLDIFFPGADVRHSYWILNSFAGAVYAVTAVYAAGRERERQIREGRFLSPAAYRLTVLSLLFFVPAMQVYAGYIENYTFTAFLISLITVTGAHFLDRSESPLFSHGNTVEKSDIIKFLVLTGFLSGLAAAFHLVAGFLAPALIYLVWILAVQSSKEAKDKNILINNFIKLSIPPAAAGISVLLTVYIIFLFLIPAPADPKESFALRPALYPLQKILSAEHLMQFVNLIWIASPGLVFLFLLNIHRPVLFIKSLKPSGKADAFVLSVTGSLLLHSFIWNPMIGFPADWDLFSLWWFPLNYYLLRRIPSLPLNEDRSGAKTAAVFMALFTFLISFSWIYSHSLSDHRSTEYFNASLVQKETVFRHLGYDPQTNSLSEESILARIPDVYRKKLFVKAKLFEIRTYSEISDYMDSHPDTAASRRLKELSERLASAILKLSEVMLLDEPSYRREFPVIWRELTEINTEISGILRPE